MIIAHKLHRFVVNPIIPQKYASEFDREIDLPTEEYQRWIVQDQMLFTWLLSSLPDSILPRVLGCKHNYQVWDAIHKHYFPLMMAKVRQLRSDLKNTKKGSQSISEHVLKIKNIVNSLLTIGETVSEQDQVDAILEGLPEEYNHSVMMVYARVDSTTVADVESLLLIQESQFEKFKVELNPGSVSVNVAQGPAQGNRGGRAWRGGRDNRGRGRGRTKPTCQICYKYGHAAFDCWNRFNENYVQPLPPPDETESVQPNASQGHVAHNAQNNSQQPHTYISTQSQGYQPATRDPSSY